MRIYPSPFGSQIPAEHRPIEHIAGKHRADYMQGFRRVVIPDLAHADHLTFDTFGLREHLDDPRLAREIVRGQRREIGRVLAHAGIQLPVMGAIHAKRGDCYAADPNLDVEECADLAAVQAELLRGHGLIFETIAQVREAEGILRGLSAKDQRRSTLSFTLKKAENGQFVLPSGEDPLDAFKAVGKQTRLGLNCFAPDYAALKQLLERAGASGFKVDLVYPNTHGFGGDVEAQGVAGFQVRQPEADAGLLVETCRPFGVETVGYCCGGTAHHLGCIHSKLHGKTGTQSFRLAA